MITESREKRILLIIITILFLANVATLIMFFVGSPINKKQGGISRKEKMQGYLKKELGYNEAQISTYKTLSQKHRASVDSMFENMKREKENRLKEMSAQNFSDSSIEMAATRTAEKQKMVEIKMLKHLKDIRELGDQNQKLKFDTGFLQYMSRHKSRSKK